MSRVALKNAIGLAATLLLTGGLAGPVLAADAPAAAVAQVKQQSPGYFRFMLGQFEVTVLSDGTVNLPVSSLLHQPKEKTLKTLKANHLSDPLETSVNAFLVNTGERLVLIDTGAGQLFGPTLGRLEQHLRAAGYTPEQVSDIFITHLHGDHIGGLSADSQRRFPKATLHVDQADTDFWLSDEKAAAAPKEQQGGFAGAKAMLGPWQKEGRLATFQQDSEVVKGIRTRATHGHTPGHNLYEVSSEGQKLVLWGDLMHVAAVQFPEPGVTIGFDSDSKAAKAHREKAFAEAAAQGYWVGAAHLPFPGVGHLRKADSGKGYVYLPINYTRLNPAQ